MPYPVAILAGGLGTRLGDQTKNCPKSLIEIAGKPFIMHQLAYLKWQGIKRIVLCVGYLGHMIESTVGNGSEWGIDIRYSYDGKQLLGTGGALKQALPLLDELFFVLYGDSYLPVEFEPIAHALSAHSCALMTVYRNHDHRHVNNVLFQEGRLIDYNKRCPGTDWQHMDYGLGVLSRQTLMTYPSDQFDLADLYHHLALQGKLTGFEVPMRFYEIGSPEGFREAEAYLIKRTKP